MVMGDQTRDSRNGLLDMAWPRCFDGYVEDSEMGGKRPKQDKTFDAGGGQCGYVSVFIMYFFFCWAWRGVRIVWLLQNDEGYEDCYQGYHCKVF